MTALPTLTATATGRSAALLRRGRPRNESCSTDILHAVLALVAEVGIAGLTMDAVATRAGVGKATIYRRWSSKEALLLDAWTACVPTHADVDTGNLREDLRMMLTGKQNVLADVELQRVYPQMIAAARVNPEVAVAYRALITERRAPMQAVLRRAVARGEIHPSTDLDLVHDLVIAPLLYRWLISDETIASTVAEQIIDIVLRGVGSPTGRAS
jgi:AcrR family transcriptional regulator